MLMVSNLAGFGARRASSVFDPSSLFANSEQGFWFDFSDLTTMFQDRAGTTQVTTDGQTVGKILDKSGNDNHAVAPSDAARPLYKTSGGLHWLQFDGVDDSLATGTIYFISANKMSEFYGLQKESTVDMIFCELGSNLNLTSGCFFFASLGVSNTSAVAKGATPEYGTRAEDTTDPWSDAGVYSQLIDLTSGASSNELRKNGVQKAINTSDLGGGTFRNDALHIGARNSSAFFVNGRIYSMIVLGRTATTQEIDDTEQWVADKTGVVLP